MQNTIKTGSTLQVRFISDYDLRPTIKVIERKGNFATLELSKSEIVKKKIYSDATGEYLFPYGKYSMAPVAKPIN